MEDLTCGVVPKERCPMLGNHRNEKGSTLEISSTVFRHGLILYIFWWVSDPPYGLFSSKMIIKINAIIQ
jgi:hypothetical protein